MLNVCSIFTLSNRILLYIGTYRLVCDRIHAIKCLCSPVIPNSVVTFHFPYSVFCSVVVAKERESLFCSRSIACMESIKHGPALRQSDPMGLFGSYIYVKMSFAQRCLRKIAAFYYYSSYTQTNTGFAIFYLFFFFFFLSRVCFRR